jgi:hypothetical protein
MTILSQHRLYFSHKKRNLKQQKINKNRNKIREQIALRGEIKGYHSLVI